MRYLVNTLNHVSPLGSHTLILFDIKLYFILSGALLEYRLYYQVKADHELVCYLVHPLGLRVVDPHRPQDWLSSLIV